MKYFFKWLLLVPLDLLVTILSVTVSPLMAQAIYFGKDNKLPEWLWLWQTPDDDAIGSNEHAMDWTRSYPLWFQCMVWLCRNSAYGFAWYVMGAKVPDNKEVKVFGNLNVNNTPYCSGWRILKADNAWELFFVCSSFPNKCFRARLGWKLDRWYNGNFSMPAQFVCSINPWKSKG